MSFPTFRCTRCGSLVRLKTNAKKRKYCGSCRKVIQENFKKEVVKARQHRTRNITVGAINVEEIEKTQGE